MKCYILTISIKKFKNEYLIMGSNTEIHNKSSVETAKNEKYPHIFIKIHFKLK